MIVILAFICLSLGMLSAPPLPFNFKPIWDAALLDAKVSHKTIAALMKLSSQQLSQQVAQQHHLSLFRLILLATDDDGRRFLEAFFARLHPHLGLDDLAMQQQLSMLRAQIDGLLKAMKTRQVTVWHTDFSKEKTG